MNAIEKTILENLVCEVEGSRYARLPSDQIQGWEDLYKKDSTWRDTMTRIAFITDKKEIITLVKGLEFGTPKVEYEKKFIEAVKEAIIEEVRLVKPIRPHKQTFLQHYLNDTTPKHETFFEQWHTQHIKMEDMVEFIQTGSVKNLAYLSSRKHMEVERKLMREHKGLIDTLKKANKEPTPELADIKKLYTAIKGKGTIDVEYGHIFNCKMTIKHAEPITGYDKPFLSAWDFNDEGTRNFFKEFKQYYLSPKGITKVWFRGKLIYEKTI